MSWLSWLFRRPKFNRFEDSYAMNRDSLWPKLQVAITNQQAEGRNVWLVAHFTDTFSILQELLAQWEIEYQIVSETLLPFQAIEATSAPVSTVNLVLSDLIDQAEVAEPEFDETVAISIIAVERHPLPIIDQRLEWFARSLPCSVHFGYYLAIDDPVVQRAVNDTTILILKQLGMEDHELITSNMISRRLNAVLARDAASFLSPIQPADCVEEWYRLNQEKA